MCPPIRRQFPAKRKLAETGTALELGIGKSKAGGALVFKAA